MGYFFWELKCSAKHFRKDIFGCSGEMFRKSFCKMPELRFVSANVLHNVGEISDIARTGACCSFQESLIGGFGKIDIKSACQKLKGA